MRLETTNMTATKATALALGLAGAYAIGVWTGPYVMESARMTGSETTTPVVQVDQPSAREDVPQPANRVARAVAGPASSPFEPIMTASATPVQQHAKSLLNQGTDVEMAADGFDDATLFVSTAYAARNTGIPFMLLKHRMLKEGRTLSEAIRMSKPELEAVLEMERARTKARAVIQKLAS